MDRLLAHYAAGREPLQSTADKAMFLCMEQQMPFLGLKMIASYFQECGWHTRFYGPNLPLEYALIAASNWKPQVIGISVSMVYALPALSAYRGLRSPPAPHRRPSRGTPRLPLPAPRKA